MKRRALVLVDESARHWLRASLPPAVGRAASRAGPVPARKRRITAQDLRDFLLAYCACFIALMVWFL